MIPSEPAGRFDGRPLAALGAAALVALAALAAVLTPLACRPGPREHGGITDSVYVEAMARLYLAPRRAAVTAPGLARRQREDSARAAVLAELGIVSDSLLRFAEAAGRDPARMASLWEAVAARVEDLGGPETERGTRFAPDSGRAPGAEEATGEPPETGRPRPAVRPPAPADRRDGAAVREREARPVPTRTAPAPSPAEVVRDTQELRERVRRLRREAVKDSG